MSTRNQHSLAGPLVDARRRFERWRRSRKVGTRIPEPLWDAAVTAAKKCGVAQTAHALSVDYYTLKNRVEAVPRPRVKEEGKRRVQAKPHRRVATAGSAVASGVGVELPFLELPAAPSGRIVECILELDSADGAKMRVHLKGVEAPDLAALSRSFWGAE